MNNGIEGQQEVSLYELLNILNNKKWIIILFSCSVLIGVILFNETSPSIYEAKTSVVIEEQKGTVTPFDYLGVSSKTPVKNRVEEIRSRTFSEDIVSVLPPDIVNRFDVPLKLSQGVTNTEYIARNIRKSINVEIVKDSEVMNIKTRNEDPLIAMAIANAVIDVLKDKEIKAKRAEGSIILEFIEEQLGNVKERLQDAEKSLRDFKRNNKITSLPVENEELLRRMTNTEVLYNTAKSDRGTIEHKLSYINNKLAEEKEGLNSSITKTTGVWAEKLKEKLLALEVQYTTLKVKNYSDTHPQIIKLKEQIEQTKQNLIQETIKITRGEPLLNPISQIYEFVKEKVSLEIDFETCKAKERILKEIVDNYENKLQSLPEKEFQLVQLTRATEVNDKIYRMLLEKYEEARITEAGQVSDIRVIDFADIPKSPIKPRKKLNLFMGLTLGIMMGTGAALFLEITDKSVKTLEGMEKILPVIGSVPSINGKHGRKTIPWMKVINNNIKKENNLRLINNLPLRSYVVESYRGIRTNIGFSSPDKPLKMVLITSACASEGKSLTTANLAIIMAQTNIKTLIMDADLRKPRIAHLFNKPQKPGFTDVIVGTKELKDVIIPSSIDNLWIIPAGTIPPDPTALLGSQKTKDLLNKLKKDFDSILLDSPPIIPITDAIILGKEVDGIIFVVRSRITGKDVIIKAVKSLNNIGAKIIGAVINDMDVKNTFGKYSYYLQE